MASPTTALRSRSTAPPRHDACSPLTAPTAIANSVSAVASLTRLSPVRIVVGDADPDDEEELYAVHWVRLDRFISAKTPQPRYSR
jgi:hypothetical protein